MTETVLQFVGGGFALCMTIWIEYGHIIGIFPSMSGWLKRTIQTVAFFFATACLLDPLIPGTANLTIHAPNTVPMTLETLVVESVPVGFLGEAGGDRVCYSGFDSRGMSQVTVKLRFLETRVKLRLFDRSSPSRSVVSDLVYVSPFVRRQFSTKIVHF